MKNVFIKSFVILTSAIFLFLGCSNFLGGSDLKTELEKEMTYSAEKNHLKVVAVSPSYSLAGAYYDSPIIISFDQPVKKETFSYTVNTIDSDISYLYKEPLFFENDTIVKLNVDRTKLETFSIAKGDVKDVTLNLNSSIKSAADSSLDKNCQSYKFRFNSNTDSNPPEIIDLYFAKTKEDAEKAKKGNTENLLSLKGFDEWITEDFYTNHVNSVWIYCRAIDNESGVKGFTAKETYLEDVSGNYVGTTNNFTTGTKTLFSAIPDKTGMYESIFEYNFVTSENGVVSLNISIQDENGNISKESRRITLIKDTVLGQNLTITNLGGYSSYCRDKDGDGIISETKEYIYTVEDFNKYAGNISVTGLEKKYFYKSYQKNYSISLNFSTDEKTFELIDSIETIDFDRQGLSLKIPVEKLESNNSDILLRFTVKDDVGNFSDTDAIIPVSPVAVWLDNLYQYTSYRVTYTEGDFYYTNYSEKQGVKNFLYIYNPSLDRIDSPTAGAIYSVASNNGIIEFDVNQDINNYGLGVASYYSTQTENGYIRIAGLIRNNSYVIANLNGTNSSDELPEISGIDFSYDYSTNKINAKVSIDNIETINNYDKVILNITEKEDTTTSYNRIIDLTENSSEILITLHKFNYSYPNFEIVGISSSKQRKEYYAFSPDEYKQFYKLMDIDTYGPNLTGYQYGYPNMWDNSIKLNYATDPSGVLLNENNKVEYTIYWTNYQNTWNKDNEDRPVEEILTFNKFIVEEEPNTNISFSIDFLKDGKYLLYYSASDTLGYITYKKLGCLTRLDVSKPTFTSSSTGSYTVTFNSNDGNSSTWSNNLKIENFKNSYSDWEIIRQGNFNSASSGINTYSGADSSLPGSYSRIMINLQSRNVSYGEQCNLPVPLYAYTPDGTKYIDSNVTYRNVIPGLNGYTVLSDRPSLAQIVYNRENLGENPDMWEKYTISSQKINQKIIDGNGEYKPDIKNVPYGYYYAVIFHFADKTSIMSAVNQKIE